MPGPPFASIITFTTVLSSNPFASSVIVTSMRDAMLRKFKKVCGCFYFSPLGVQCSAVQCLQKLLDMFDRPNMVQARVRQKVLIEDKNEPAWPPLPPPRAHLRHRLPPRQLKSEMR